MAKLYKTDGRIKIVQPDNGKTFTLEECQRYVGGFIELHGIGKGQTMICNEDGHCKGLPQNASAMYLWEHRKGYCTALVGDILVIKQGELQ